jgi:hypothetical protein
MKAPFDFVIEPKGNRYNNTKKVGDKDLILNTEIYKRDGKWRAPKGYCFVQPIKQRDKTKLEKEEECIGIVKYTDGVNGIGDLVGFTPFSTYEFIIDSKRLYRVLNKFITIKYEYQGNEEAYNPSWA